MESFKPLPPDPETVIVTGVPTIGEIHFSDTAGRPIYDTAAMSPKAAENFVDRLAEFYLQVGMGDHTIADIAESTQNPSAAVTAAINRFSEFMPPQSFTDKGSTVQFGKIALAQRPPTAQEKEMFKIKKEEAAKVAFEQRKEQIEREDPNKLDLTAYDHAMIMVNERLYYLPFENAEAMLAARVIEYFSHIPQDNRRDVYFRIPRVMKHIWEEMPIAERALFTTDESSLYATKGNPLDDPFRRAMNGLTAALGITRRGLTVSEFTISPKAEVLVAFEQVPPTTPYTTQEATTLFAPGTDRESLLKGPTTESTDKELQAAQEVWRMFSQGEPVGQSDALLMLDVVMTREGKHALQSLLPPDRDIKQVLDKIHNIVYRSLRSGYWQAKRNRTIAGNHFTGAGSRIQQVSGGLPSTTKWHIGVKGESEYKP